MSLKKVTWIRSVLRSLLLGAIALGAVLAPAEPRASAQKVSLVVFDEALAPYGTWMANSRHQRVWRPDPGVVGPDFQPYASHGEWIYTDEGWAWESGWDWGWAPFHYGRWYVDASYGWVWVPDTVWAPAWVDWRYGQEYVGWVPLPPREYADTVVPSRWFFVPAPRMTGGDVLRHRVAAPDVKRVYATTTVIRDHTRSGTSYAGPPVRRVEGAAGHPIVPVHVAPPRAGVIARVHVAQGHDATVVPVQAPAAPARRPEGGAAAAPPPSRQAPHAPATRVHEPERQPGVPPAPAPASERDHAPAPASERDHAPAPGRALPPTAHASPAPAPPAPAAPRPQQPAQPAQQQPAQPRPAQPRPAQPQPAQPQPAQQRPAQPQPAQHAPAPHAQPQHAPAQPAQPAQQQPAQHAQQQPAQQQPAQRAPAPQQPAQQAPPQPAQPREAQPRPAAEPGSAGKRGER